MTQSTRHPSRFADLIPGAVIAGLDANGPVEILALQMHGTSAATGTWANDAGRPDRRVIYGDVLPLPSRERRRALVRLTD